MNPISTAEGGTRNERRGLHAGRICVTSHRLVDIWSLVWQNGDKVHVERDEFT